MTRVIIIPARLASQRLSEKLLLAATGQPLIQHTYERCAQVEGVTRVVVAAGGELLAQVVRAFGGEFVLTDPDLPSGTDRVAAAAAALGLSEQDLVVNVQGDEPEIDPSHVAQLFELLEQPSDISNREASVATLATARQDESGFQDPNRVKVVMDAAGYALYFSRSSIPYPRGKSGSWLCHVGVYGFRPQALQRFAQAPPSHLEQTEKLEQLRLLEMGMGIRVALVDQAAPGIDTDQDYQAFVTRVRGRT